MPKIREKDFLKKKINVKEQPSIRQTGFSDLFHLDFTSSSVPDPFTETHSSPVRTTLHKIVLDFASEEIRNYHGNWEPQEDTVHRPPTGHTPGPRGGRAGMKDMIQKCQICLRGRVITITTDISILNSMYLLNTTSAAPNSASQLLILVVCARCEFLLFPKPHHQHLIIRRAPD